MKTNKQKHIVIFLSLLVTTFGANADTMDNVVNAGQRATVSAGQAVYDNSTSFYNGASGAVSNFFGASNSNGQNSGGLSQGGSIVGGMSGSNYMLPSGNGVVNTNAGISFAPAYNLQSDANYLTSQGCDPNVYNSLYQQWAQQTQMTINNSRSGGIMQQYINGAPSAQQASACLSGVMGQINSIAKTASAVLAFMNGSTDWAAMGDTVAKGAMSQACSAVNNLSGQFVTNSLSPVTGAISQGTGMVNSIGNVQTPLGNFNTNVGNMILNQSQSAGNATPPLLK